MAESTFKLAMVNDLFVLILDEDCGKSVTNDAHNVINELQTILPDGIGSRAVYYRDTDGRYDRLLVSDGVFSGFAPCSPGQQIKFTEILNDGN